MSDKPNYWLTYILCFFSFLGCIGILIGIYMFIEYSGFEKKEYYIENLGYLGSYFSGLTSFFILFLTVLAVYFSNKTYKKEGLRVKQQRFEDHFFHLLQVHRENVKNIEINTITGKEIKGVKAILLMFRELMLILELINNKHTEEFNNIRRSIFSLKRQQVFFKEKLENKYLVEISFYCFFIGVGKRSNRTLKYYLESRFGDKLYVSNVVDFLSNNRIREKIRKKKDFPYKLFGGHQTRLGHYYRHLFHTIKMIDSYQEGEENDEIYKDYVRKLRIQLNTYEQALLIVNSLSVFGKGWEQYIWKYKLVKNLPKDFYDKEKELDLEKIIKDISFNYNAESNKYFEYEEQIIEKL
ncbi:putative phage abortive infection protein [Acinetobacter albensis]|nr:putative phage abortive infection protein [Acinetobacter albensis]